MDSQIRIMFVQIKNKNVGPMSEQMINLSENEKPKDKNGEIIPIIVCGEYHVENMFL